MKVPHSTCDEGPVYLPPLRGLERLVSGGDKSRDKEAFVTEIRQGCVFSGVRTNTKDLDHPEMIG